ncbi:MAG: hypothetical protein ABIR16_01730 [Dokdonella sp.]
MIQSRHALYPLIGLCAVLSACSGKADKLSDSELARMLHTEGLADERVDASAVDCLRAWSDDSGLAAGLPPKLVDESGKSDCRRHMQAWLDDGSRNPRGLMFVDVATPKVSRRAMDLLAALPPMEVAPSVAQSTTPSAGMTPTAAPQVVTQGAVNGVPQATAEAAYEERVQITNSTNQSMDQYDSVCEEAQNLAKTREFDAGTLARINNCKQTASTMRQRIDGVVQRGTAFDVSMATRGADQELQMLRQLIGKPAN